MRYYVEKYPEDVEKVVLHIKGAFSHGVGLTGSPEAIRASVVQALEGLGGTKIIDVFEMGETMLGNCHDRSNQWILVVRVNLKTPIEISMKTLTGLIKEGKIGGIGLNEVSANTIRKAYAVRPTAAVEVEL